MSAALRLGLVVALSAEVRALGAGAASVAACGVGAARAARAAETLVASGADVLVSFGVAGGLGASARAGTVLLPHTVRWRATDYATDAGLAARLERALAGRARVERGRHLAVETMADARAKRELAVHDPAQLGLDLESGAVAAVARAAGLACLVVRAVCDGPDVPVPADVQRLLGEDGRARGAGAVRLVLARPSALVDLARLGFGFARALASLRVVGRQVRALGEDAAHAPRGTPGASVSGQQVGREA